MHRRARPLTALLVLATTLGLGAAAAEVGAQALETTSRKKHPPLYTTYFYTAGEAVVHGYEAGTKVRLVSVEKGGTVWQGTVGAGEMQTVQTGKGVFGFLSDKKAAILVGTPTSCAVVGYFVKDQEGRYRSNRFFTQLPSRTHQNDERMLVWAYEPTSVVVTDLRTRHVIRKGRLGKGEFLELAGAELIGNRALEVRSTGATVSVQVYYDQGFIVPSREGRGAGTEFFTYVGSITGGDNDLNVVAHQQNARVTITDLRGHGEVLWKGPIKKGDLHTLTLARRYVRVQSDVPVNVVVAAFGSHKAGYAEHHFGTGLEGGGIENDFLVTTSGELWLFSYYDGNPVVVTEARGGKPVFSGTLGAGGVRGLSSGAGLFRVKSRMGLSVMGGASACGADYSPAAGLFAVDEAVFDVVAQVQAERLREAQKRGQALSTAAASAPITDAEYGRYQARRAAPRAGSGARRADAPPAAAPAPLSLEEVNQRAAAIRKQ